MNEETNLTLDLLNVSLHSFIGQLKEDNKGNTETIISEFDNAEFMKQLGALSDTLSHECTKFSMVFTDESKPSAKACESLCNRLIGLSAALCTTTRNLPTNGIGVHFRRAIFDAVVDVFGSFSALVTAAKEGSANVKAQLKETGTVWEACERLKALPKDSRQLLLRNTTDTLNMVNDAFTEIQELSTEFNPSLPSISENDDEENGSQSLNEREKVQLIACTQLVKAAKATLSKSRSSITQSQTDFKSTLDADDQLTSSINRISPSVDNVVSSFYESPLNFETLDNEVSKLHENIQEILTTFEKTPYYQETDKKWIEILFTAVQHNFMKYHHHANESASK